MIWEIWKDDCFAISGKLVKIRWPHNLFECCESARINGLHMRSVLLHALLHSSELIQCFSEWNFFYPLNDICKVNLIGFLFYLESNCHERTKRKWIVVTWIRRVRLGLVEDSSDDVVNQCSEWRLVGYCAISEKNTFDISSLKRCKKNIRRFLAGSYL